MAIFPQPGWYPDSHSDRKERLWNGHGWTEYWRLLGSGSHSGEAAWFDSQLPSEEIVPAGNRVTGQVITHVDLPGERILDTRRGRLDQKKSEK